MVDIEGILEEVVVKVMGHASRKNAFWLISMDRDCIYLIREAYNQVFIAYPRTLENPQNTNCTLLLERYME
jgi:hypothetical protein